MSVDRGLQPERTSLAWRRTGLAAVVATSALVRVAAVRGSLAIALLSGVVGLVAAATLFQGIGRSDPDAPGPVVLPRAAHATVLVTVTVGCAGLTLVMAT